MSQARQIWKYDIPAGLAGGDPFFIRMPGPHKVVAVQYQKYGGYLWAEVQPGWPEADHHFQWFPTGRPIPDDMEHRATIFEGAFVWHLYETDV